MKDDLNRSPDMRAMSSVATGYSSKNQVKPLMKSLAEVKP